MANTDLHHDVPYHRPAFSPVNWSAALWAWIIAGPVLAVVIAKADTGMAVVIGAACGLVLYAIDFYGFTRWFPWFADARD